MNRARKTKLTEETVLAWVDAGPAELREIREDAADLWREGLITLDRFESGDLYITGITKLGASLRRVNAQKDAPECDGCKTSSGDIKEYIALDKAGDEIVVWMHEACFAALPLVRSDSQRRDN